MKEPVLLIVGCSNAAGSEIDGTEDSNYNRQHSFGNLLAAKLGRRAINIAQNGATNQGIARTLLEWYTQDYNPDTMDLLVLVAWSESARLELPVTRHTWHEKWSPNSDFLSKESRGYLRVNPGYAGSDTEEQEWIRTCHNFMSAHTAFMEVLSAEQVLQLQFFFNLHNIKYIMCNTMHMFSSYPQVVFYKNLINKNVYLNFDDNDGAFYWKYRKLGYKNPKAKYWHHNETPHSLFAEELFALCLNNNLV